MPSGAVPVALLRQQGCIAKTELRTAATLYVVSTQYNARVPTPSQSHPQLPEVSHLQYKLFEHYRLNMMIIP